VKLQSTLLTFSFTFHTFKIWLKSFGFFHRIQNFEVSDLVIPKVNIAALQTFKGLLCKGLEVRGDLLFKSRGCFTRANICYWFGHCQILALCKYSSLWQSKYFSLITDTFYSVTQWRRKREATHSSSTLKNSQIQVKNILPTTSHTQYEALVTFKGTPPPVLNYYWLVTY
jgi:hypothetical protein